jgi:hypothetical protein
LARPEVRRSLADAAFGAEGAVASTVYGTVVVMATISATYAVEKEPWRLAGIVASTVAVLWVAHMYAHGLSESLELRRRLSRREAQSIARRELGMVLAAVLPCVALVFGAIGLFGEKSAVAIALGVGLLILAGEGVRYARIERLGPLGSLVAIVSTMGLGLLVVLLKVTVEH